MICPLILDNTDSYNFKKELNRQVEELLDGDNLLVKPSQSLYTEKERGKMK